ncbi:MAG TPA: polysaccharide biosynthesis C-terminal domain-containing protein [Candidatus Cloacimonadota bacterium]|nr:polysaccharide biosynthesis C-terminal domain-containing protein [Candidatus Cloacimonadales bacterium]HOQ79512.1 polysaccharide biosynthesis C-terminal domain-containing protein [Candidatus Cloacimonadota bacterium]HPY96317.1 polysaccharide biosynthesis C-terminal domain-containing protein [Candidatus Cloacimonadota bacterium]HQB40984.1 polysaccharide biosynthesis C-terminal domain-containing protein [Candidatus Cloacimonadota bacterium]
MRKHFMKFMQHSVIYGVSNILSRTVTFFLLPIYLAYLTAADYGILEISNTFFSLLLVVVLLNIDSGLFKLFYDKDVEFSQEEKVGTVFSFYFLYGLGISTLLIFLSPYISTLIFGSKDFSYITILVVLSSFFQGLVQLYLSIYRMKEKPFIYCAFNIALTILLALLNILFVVKFQRNYQGVREASVIGIFSIAFILFALNYKIKFRINIQALKRVLFLSIPLAGSGLASWALNLTDRYMLRVLLPVETAFTQIGIYGLSSKYASIMQILIVTPFMMAWSTLMFTYQYEENAKEIYARVLDIFVAGSIVLYLLSSIFSKFILNLLTSNQDFSEAFTIVPLLSLSFLSYGYYMVFTVGVTLVEKTKYMMYSNIYGAIVNIGMNFFLIPLLGFKGAAISSLSANIVRISYLYFFSQKRYYIPYKIFRNAFIVAIALISSNLGLFYLDNNLQKALLFILTVIVIITVSPLPFYKLIKQRIGK